VSREADAYLKTQRVLALDAKSLAITGLPATLDVAGAPVVISTTQANLIYEMALLHGLVPGSPLVVTPTSRSAGAVTQTIAGTDTVTVTTVSSDVLVGDVGNWIEQLAALHGLTSPLVTTATSRSAGAISQTFTTVGTTVTVSA
jgi:hypothetical protein